MRSPLVEIFVLPMETPTDTSALEAEASAGRVDPRAIVAVIGKSEGTGLAVDSTRSRAERAIRKSLAMLRNSRIESIEQEVSMIFSGGCFGVISPHMTVVCRSWVENADAPPPESRLVVGRARSAAIAPEDIGRLGQVSTVTSAVTRALDDAGLTEFNDVGAVFVKGPALSEAGVEDASRRGKTVVSKELTTGFNSAMSYSNDASALGVGIALGEVEASRVSDDAIRRDWELYSSVAITSCEAGRDFADIVVFGNLRGSYSKIRIGHAIIRDLLDADGVRNALYAAGWAPNANTDDGGRSEIVQVFAKLVVKNGTRLHGRHITLEIDRAIHRTAKVIGGVLVASVTGEPMSFVSGGERNSHQGPPGGSPVAAIVRRDD